MFANTIYQFLSFILLINISSTFSHVPVTASHHLQALVLDPECLYSMFRHHHHQPQLQVCGLLRLLGDISRAGARQ